ncbi:hypothetical protein GpartN1_g4237.t1 [Galdieria partita]|uniref:Uncharacterized protein n=1 Tax=Galdieria partita TaxID=83374 RepID=A0A9C7UR58_9RHOD|nr:hypothetical protein GpartN1_g4237.t1 [Galdieria partita]
MAKLVFIGSCWNCTQKQRLQFRSKKVTKLALINRRNPFRLKDTILFTTVLQQSDSSENKEQNNNSDSSAENDINPASELHPSWNIYEEPGNKCLICLGRGKVKCLYCFGRGNVRIGPEEEDNILCTQCNGEKYTTCERCEGTGVRPNVIYDFETHQWVPGPSNADVLKRIKEKWTKNQT